MDRVSRVVSVKPYKNFELIENNDHAASLKTISLTHKRRPQYKSKGKSIPPQEVFNRAARFAAIPDGKEWNDNDP